VRRKGTPPDNVLELTKLRAAPVLQAEVTPCAPAGKMAGHTASQLIAGCSTDI
jgi:hypothetical protein